MLNRKYIPQKVWQTQLHKCQHKRQSPEKSVPQHLESGSTFSYARGKTDSDQAIHFALDGGRNLHVSMQYGLWRDEFYGSVAFWHCLAPCHIVRIRSLWSPCIWNTVYIGYNAVIMNKLNSGFSSSSNYCLNIIEIKQTCKTVISPQKKCFVYRKYWCKMALT